MRLASAFLASNHIFRTITTCEVSDIYSSKSITILYEDGEFEFIDTACKRRLRLLEKGQGKHKRKISERKMSFPIPVPFLGQLRGRQCRPGEVSTVC